MVFNQIDFHLVSVLLLLVWWALFVLGDKELLGG